MTQRSSARICKKSDAEARKARETLRILDGTGCMFIPHLRGPLAGPGRAATEFRSVEREGKQQRAAALPLKRASCWSRRLTACVRRQSAHSYELKQHLRELAREGPFAIEVVAWMARLLPLLWRQTSC